MLTESISGSLSSRNQVFFAHASHEIGRHILAILKSFGLETCRFEGESVSQETGEFSTAFVVTGRKEFWKDSDLFNLHAWAPEKRISLEESLANLGIVIPAWAWNVRKIIAIPQPMRPDILTTPSLQHQLRKLCLRSVLEDEADLQAQFWPDGQVPLEHMRAWDY